MLAVTGSSGSGKSTFLHLVGGMERPDTGRIEIDGLDLADLGKQRLAEYRNRQVGFVFQSHHLLPEFSALENVMFPLLLRGVSFREASQKGRTWLEEVGLEDRVDHKPGQLSGGEQQRVALSRALVGEPRLLLADEPTGDLDAATSAGIHRLLLRLHERHRLTSIIVTHEPRLAGLCDEQQELVGGKLRMSS